MRYLLDSNAFIDAARGKLPRKLERRLLASHAELLVSILTPWEIALKPSLKKYNLTPTTVEQKIRDMEGQILALQLNHATIFYSLPQYEEHRDPFDRMLVAQALAEGCALVSRDQRFPLYANVGLNVVWE